MIPKRALQGTVIGACVLVAGIAGSVWKHRHVAEGRPVLQVPKQAAEEVNRPQAPAERVAFASAELSANGDAPESAEQAIPAAPTSTGIPVAGTVLDLSGARRAGVGVALEDSPAVPIAVSASDGSFAALLPLGAGLVASDPELTTLLKHCVRGAGETGAVIVVARAVDLAGVVIDARGTPVAGAGVWLAAQLDGPLASVQALDSAMFDLRGTRSGPHGRFALQRVPSGPGITVQAHEASSGATSAPVLARSAEDLVLRLDPGPALARTVRGVVLYPSGEPAPGCEVRLAESHRTQSDEGGRFELTVLEDFEQASLIAFLRGNQPAVLEGFGRSLAESLGGPLEVRLVLGPETLSIRGSVQDEQGRMLHGWCVALADGLAATHHRLPPVFVEELIDPLGGDVRTDETGRFQVGGLGDREYVLRVWDPLSLVSVRTEAVRPGGPDLRVVIPSDSLWPVVHGRVLAPDGTALEGVRVELRMGESFPTGLHLVARESVLTDAEGGFAFEHVPRRGLRLHCQNESICEQLWTVAEDCDPGDLRVTVERKCRLRLHLQSAEARTADAAGVWCDSARRGFLYLPAGFGGPVLPLEGLENVILATGEGSRELALYRAGIEVKRVPLELGQGDVAIVEL